MDRRIDVVMDGTRRGFQHVRAVLGRTSDIGWLMDDFVDDLDPVQLGVPAVVILGRAE
jgi:hypothetical protein